MSKTSDIVSQLDQPGNAVVLLNTDDSFIELIEQLKKLEQANHSNDLAKMAIMKELSKLVTYWGFSFSTSSEGINPAGALHLDIIQPDCQDYDQYNYWIAMKDVNWRPLSFV
jgi:hypothetical protein